MIIRVPPVGTKSEQQNGQEALKLVKGYVVEVWERPIHNHHVDILSEMWRCDSSKWATIYTDLSIKTEFISAVLEDSFAIFPHVVWGGIFVAAHPTFTSCIASIVPADYIDILLKKEAQIIGMRVVDHILVEHGVGVA